MYPSISFGSCKNIQKKRGFDEKIDHFEQAMEKISLDIVITGIAGFWTRSCIIEDGKKGIM